MKERKWHSLGVEEVLAGIGSDENGLSKIEAEKRLAQFGRNELPQERGHSALHLFLLQFKSPLMYIMGAATGVSFFLKNTTEGVFVLVVMMSNAIVGFYQEHKANQSLKALKGVIKPRARVVRDKREAEIDAAIIVPGDIIVLRAGDKVPADGRVIQAKDLKVSEAALTGESKPVEKGTAPLAQSAQIAERTGMVFMGTLVEEGSATAVVTATGRSTEYGDIVELLKETPEEDTPLQKMVISLSKFIGIFITCVVAFIVLEGYIAGHDLKTIFETSLALFVSAIPEGLLPGITIVLVLGMRRILKRKGLVRRLAATETLGGVTVICTDKTGTLTLGKMQASSIVTALGAKALGGKNDAEMSDAERACVRISVLSTDAFVENPGASLDELVVRGNLTDQALLRMAVRCGFEPYSLGQAEPVIDSILFSSERKYSAALRQDGSGKTLYVLGAPEVVLEKISAYLGPDGERKAEGESFEKLIEKKNEMVEKGFRVVACAYRAFPSDEQGGIEAALRELTLAGFVAIDDPVREDVPDAFKKTKRAGIRTVIVTGDHARTAQVVAEKVGLKIGSDAVLEGRELEAISDKELGKRSRSVALYARVSPRHKLRIVKALQKNGEVVAMFGDGVNDAPALKAADIGVAVDTRVSAAREVADLALLDGGFGTVIKAIEQGRIIFQNIRKVFLYLITQDFSQFFVFMVSIFLGLPLPVIAAQLLLVNLVESGLPDLALTTEQEKEGIMDVPPRNPKESVLNSPAKKWMFSIFATSGSLAMLFYVIMLRLVDLDTARTMMMVYLCLESLFLVFSVRSFTKSIIRPGIFSNKILNWAVVLSFALVLAAVYVPWFRTVLHTVPLSLPQWLAIVSTNLLEILILDRVKLVFFGRRKRAARA